jgi:quercetin dioxygenase-like cupin family protein
MDDMTQGLVRTLVQGISTRVFSGEKIMISVCRLDPHVTGLSHSHSEEQWGFLVEGGCWRMQAGVDVGYMKPGTFWHIPGGVSHSMRCGSLGAVVLDIFSPPREAYRQEGTGYGC